MGLAHSLSSILVNKPTCPKRSNSLLMEASAAKVDFLFALKISVTFTLILNLTYAFVLLSRPSEKKSGNFIINSFKKFSPFLELTLHYSRMK